MTAAVCQKSIKGRAKARNIQFPSTRETLVNFDFTFCRAARDSDLILSDIVGECGVTGKTLDILFQSYSFNGTGLKFDGSIPKPFKTLHMSGSEDTFCEFSFVTSD